MPMGDVSEAWLYDDDDDEVMGVLTQNFVEIPDDEVMGVLTQNFVEIPDDEVMGVLTQNPLPEQIGGGIDTPHRDFWTPMPIDDTTNLEKAIVLSEKRRRRNPRFNVEEVSYDALVDCDRIPQSSRGMPLISIIEVVRLLFHVLLMRATVDMDPHDMIRFILFADELDRPISTCLMQVSQMTVEVLFAAVLKVLQSKSTIKLDEGFAIEVVKIRRPRGGARNARPVNPNVDRLKKTSVFAIDDEGTHLCCAMSLILGKAIIENDADLPTLRKRANKLLMRKAMQLHTTAGVPEGPCGFSEIAIFERHLNIQVIVIGPENIKETSYKGPERSEKIYLWLHDNHYDLIKSPKGFYGASYYCEFCNVPFKTLIAHACSDICHICRRDQCVKGSPKRCSHCDRNCASDDCYNAHKQNGICRQIWQCRKCCKVMEWRKCTKYEHKCGETRCKGCKNYVGSDHQCYLSSKPSKSSVDKLMFFDVETDQSSGDHVVNFVVAQYANGDERVFKGYDALDKFCNFLFDKRHKGFTILAHNLKGFDGQFILRWLLEKGHDPKVIPQGSKLMSIHFQTLQMTFIDSFNFLPMALSKLPKTFGLNELAKGYFPHLFNKEEKQNYVGPLPARQFYSPDTMSSTERQKFHQWYDQRQLEIFDFQKEMLLYCRSDVDILRRCCLEFRKEFMFTAGVDPFCYITIASACMACFRSRHISLGTIAMIPQNGYVTGNYSKDSVRWLDFVSAKENICIYHAENGNGEITICGVKVDGFCEETNTIYQYHGCFYHGCEICFDRDTIHPLTGSPMNAIRQKTRDMTAMYQSRGYTVIEMWEHTFQRMIRSDPELKTFVKNHISVDRLNPRDAFYGGRTNAVCLMFEGDAKYIDFTSLYPWCNKYCSYPVGHPEIVIPDEGATDISQYFGIIKCTVLPPRQLYHPVLPYRHDKKLMFALCRTCCERLQQEPCQHDKDSRKFTGTWVTEEVKKAIEKGYVILKVHEVYNFSRSSTTLFKSYIDTFLKTKHESSGWPAECITDAQKDAYISSYLAKEGIQLDPENVEMNPGKRAVSKLALNSFWGRFGMNRHKSQLTYIRTLENFNKLISDTTKSIEELYFPSENVCAVQWKQNENFLGQDASTNIFIAAFTTCHARLKLYSEIEKLGRDVLYFDTDSIVYKSTGTNDPPLGNFLGEFTDELGGETITKFISGGPKNYAYVTSTNKTVCKIRGFTLNFKNSLLLNFEAMKKLVQDMDTQTKVPIVNDRKICRDAKKRRIFNREEIKRYGVIYNKRVIQSDWYTLPYGY
ncbi:hypothetical protein JTE90_011604 [Oedothorax gibbosus]|uniref:DNA-directed DNA polymerase n=1 Tax=Oedothorax gibbosus TaxID=931172 RepID=A0AAV6TP16_9ARAC|nr:hypothetical protein JTE90_011604 [Oedothorax gibbosus]